MPTRRKGTIREQLERLQHVVPRRDLRTGLMYVRADELRLSSKAIKLYGVFASDQGTFMLRAHIFESEDSRTHEAWADWLSEHYSKILRDSIIPGMINKTGGVKIWRLYRPVGFVHVLSKSVHSRAHTKRNKANKKGRKNGRSRVRRR